MSRFTTLLLAAAFSLSLVGTAVADSFLTSVSTSSKTAAKVGPAPYTGTVYSVKSANIAARALRVIRTTRNLAIAFDVLQRVDSVAMDNAQVGRQLRLGLARLSRSGDPKMQLLRGVNLLLSRETTLTGAASQRAIAYVRDAAARLPGDSAAQLLAALSVAQRDAFGLSGGAEKWEKRTPLKREAAGLLANAQQLEARTRHPRALVREGLRQAREYFPLYEGYKGLLK
jgi:hypothetical protein